MFQIYDPLHNRNNVLHFLFTSTLLKLIQPGIYKLSMKFDVLSKYYRTKYVVVSRII